MENLLHLAKSWYMLYQNELFLGVLACMFVLMILTLLAVRRCRKQIKRLTENTKEMTKVAINQSNLALRRERALERQEKEAGPEKKKTVSKEDEELFGSVIQEIFP